MIVQPDLPYAEVIGDPIAHSKSPLIHRHWLAGLGIAGDYRATRVEADELGSFLDRRRADGNWRGCNVTIPHKQAVLPHLDVVDGRAAAIGAVNCIIPTSAGLVGYNTDVDGVAAALDETPLEGRKAAIIGAGGAARAALAYLAGRNSGTAALLVRNPDKARALEGSFSGKLVVGSFEGAMHLLDDAAAIINASPLGMTGCEPMPRELLAAVAAASKPTLLDMVYSPIETEFLSAARAQAVDGLTMLVGQAARAFELFFGTRPPVADQALRDLLTA